VPIKVSSLFPSGKILPKPVFEGISDGTIQPEKEPCLHWKIDEFEYTDKGITRFSAHGERVARPSWYKATEMLEDMKRVYEAKRKWTQQRLSELRTGWNKTDEGIFAELCYCILLAGRSAEKTLPVIVALEKSKLLFQGSKEEVEQYLEQQSYAFKERSSYITNWRNRFSHQGFLRIKSHLESRFMTPKGWNIYEMRKYLASQNNGVGWKVASQFLRNVGIGLGYGLALLDRHIQRELMKFGYISKVYDQALSRT